MGHAPPRNTGTLGVPGNTVKRISSVLFTAWLVTPGAFAAEDARSAVVKKLYKDFAWETGALPTHRPVFTEQRRFVLEKYLTRSLASLLIRDNTCAERTHEICQLDFSPLWDSQDPEGATFNVAGPGPGNTISVTLTYPNNRPRVVNYDLKQTATGWRIDNIRTKEWSLRRILGKQ
jgi:hypothetical protein